MKEQRENRSLSTLNSTIAFLLRNHLHFLGRHYSLGSLTATGAGLRVLTLGSEIQTAFPFMTADLGAVMKNDLETDKSALLQPSDACHQSIADEKCIDQHVPSILVNMKTLGWHASSFSCILHTIYIKKKCRLGSSKVKEAVSATGE